MQILWIDLSNAFFCLLIISVRASASSTGQHKISKIRHEDVNPGGNVSIKIDPSQIGWHTDAASSLILAWKNDKHRIKKLKLTNGVPGKENCYIDIDPRFRPCEVHFNISMCGQAFCINITGVTEFLAGTYLAYLYYPGTKYNTTYMKIIVRIKDAPTTNNTELPDKLPADIMNHTTKAPVSQGFQPVPVSGKPKQSLEAISPLWCIPVVVISAPIILIKLTLLLRSRGHCRRNNRLI